MWDKNKASSSAPIIRENPTRSARMSYSAYFGGMPTGRPYTYREFANIADDIENPAFAEVVKVSGW